MILHKLEYCLLIAVFVTMAGGISENDKVACKKDDDCGSPKFSCCRNDICCPNQYHQQWRTRCFENEDCTGVKDFFTQTVMNEHCCNTKECCSEQSYRNQTTTEKVDKHFKFRVVVLGTIAATIILIATIVTFWCSSDTNRRRRRSFSFRSRQFSSVFETSRDNNCGEVSTSYPAIVCDLKTIKESANTEPSVEESLTSSEIPQEEEIKFTVTNENSPTEQPQRDGNDETTACLT